MNKSGEYQDGESHCEIVEQCAQLGIAHRVPLTSAGPTRVLRLWRHKPGTLLLKRYHAYYLRTCISPKTSSLVHEESYQRESLQS